MKCEKFSVRIFKLILLLTGIRIESRDKKFEKYYAWACVVAYPLLMVPQFLPIATSDLLYHKMIALVFFLSTVNILVMTVWLHCQRDDLVLIYYTIIKGEKLFDDECSQYFDSTVKHKIRIFLFTLFVIVAIVYITPFISRYSSFSEQKHDSFSVLFIPASYPWSMDSLFSISMTIFVQAVTDFIPSMTAISYVLCLTYFHALFMTMKLSLEKRILTLDRVVTLSGYEIGEEWMYVSTLHDVIDSYNLLMRTMKIFTYSMKMYLFMAPWTFCAAGAVLTMFQLTTSLSVLTLIKMLSFQTLFGANLVICTQLGQWCYDLNHEILEALYQIRWQRRSIQFRKIMLIFMCLLQRAYRVKPFGASTLNWCYIAKATRFTYSVLQVFLKIK